MKRGGKITRQMKILQAEQKVIKSYKDLVVEATLEVETKLRERILELKKMRDRAIESIRKGERDEEAKQESKAPGSDETSGRPGQEGHEPKSGSDSGLEGQTKQGKGKTEKA